MNIQDSLSNLNVSDWAQVISAAGTLIAAIVAVIAARQSFKSARENNSTNEQMIRPQVSVYVQSTNVAKNLIDIIVSNTGGGIARDLSFTVVGDDLKLSHQHENRETISQLRFIQKGITILPPGGIRKYFALSVVGVYQEILETSTEIQIEYKNNSRTKTYKDCFSLDFASLSESGWQDDNSKAPKSIADELKKIREILGKKS